MTDSRAVISILTGIAAIAISFLRQWGKAPFSNDVIPQWAKQVTMLLVGVIFILTGAAHFLSSR